MRELINCIVPILTAMRLEDRPEHFFAGEWLMVAKELAERFIRLNQQKTRIKPEMIDNAEQELLNTLERYLCLATRMNAENFTAHCTSQLSMLHINIARAKIDDLAAHGGPIQMFTRFYIFAEQWEIDAFFENFMRLTKNMHSSAPLKNAAARRR